MLDDPDGYDRISELGLRLKRKRDMYDLFDDLDAAECTGMISMNLNPRDTAWRSEEDEPKDQCGSEVYKTHKVVRGYRELKGEDEDYYDQ